MPQTLQHQIIHSLFLSQGAKEKWLKYLNRMTVEEKNVLEKIFDFERKELESILKKSEKDWKKMLETLRIFEKGLLRRFYRASEEKEKEKEDEKLRNMINE